MTYYNWTRINREIAEAMEPEPDLIDGIPSPMDDEWPISDGRLYYWSHTFEKFLPRDFHIDGNAMLALIAAFMQSLKSPTRVKISRETYRASCDGRLLHQTAVFDASLDTVGFCITEKVCESEVLAIADALGIETGDLPDD